MPLNESTAIIAGAVLIFLGALTLIIRELFAPRGHRRNTATVAGVGSSSLPKAAPDTDLSERGSQEEADLTQVGRKKLPHTSSEDSGSFSKSAELTVYAPDAEPNEDEWTGTTDRILTYAVGQTDPGKRRRRNEDSYLLLPEHGLFMVADGVGGHSGGDIASALATATMERVFKSGNFTGTPDPTRPKRANELAFAMQSANEAVRARAEGDPALEGMATTATCARFTAKKRRVYIAHVGDSPAYRLRANKLVRLTTDHTLARFGIPGTMGAQLSRALGIRRELSVDIVIDAPTSGDRYLLCSDGLSKMVPDDVIAEALNRHARPEDSATELVRLANERGGLDNITVIVVGVDEPSAAPPT